MDRSSRSSAGLLALAAVTAVLAACGGAKPAPSPEASPAAVTLAPERPADAPAAIGPVTSGAASPAAPRAAAAASAAPPAPAASPSPSPTPDPEEAKRAEEAQRLRAEVAAAKAKADALTAQANTECPDLKPGELRHPGAVGHCRVLKEQAAEAVRQYELAKKDAQAAGVTVQ